MEKTKPENKVEKKPEQKAETAQIRNARANAEKKKKEADIIQKKRSEVLKERAKVQERKAEKKKRIAETVQLGNTGFDKEAIENMSWDDFQKKYAGRLSGIDIKKAFRKLGGKMNTK